MLDRRRVVGEALAALACTPRVGAQTKPRVRYNEVVHSILYAPAYVANRQGIVRRRRTRACDGNGERRGQVMAALLSGGADRALVGLETAIHVQVSDSPTKARIFCGLTASDGFMLIGREKVDRFDWQTLRGKEIFGFRPGSTPLLFLKAALRKNGPPRAT